MLDSSNDNAANPINAFIGARIREARKGLGLSQSYVGYYLKISYQALQKIEKGRSRANAEQLAILCRVLGVHISYFYQGMPPEYLENLSNAHPELPPMQEDIMSRPETQDLVKSYYAVEDNQQRQSLLTMLKAFAKKTFATEASPSTVPSPFLH